MKDSKMSLIGWIVIILAGLAAANAIKIHTSEQERERVKIHTHHAGNFTLHHHHHHVKPRFRKVFTATTNVQQSKENTATKSPNTSIKHGKTQAEIDVVFGTPPPKVVDIFVMQEDDGKPQVADFTDDLFDTGVDNDAKNHGQQESSFLDNKKQRTNLEEINRKRTEEKNRFLETEIRKVLVLYKMVNRKRGVSYQFALADRNQKYTGEPTSFVMLKGNPDISDTEIQFVKNLLHAIMNDKVLIDPRFYPQGIQVPSMDDYQYTKTSRTAGKKESPRFLNDLASTGVNSFFNRVLSEIMHVKKKNAITKEIKIHSNTLDPELVESENRFIETEINKILFIYKIINKRRGVNYRFALANQNQKYTGSPDSFVLLKGSPNPSVTEMNFIKNLLHAIMKDKVLIDPLLYPQGIAEKAQDEKETDTTPFVKEKLYNTKNQKLATKQPAITSQPLIASTVHEKTAEPSTSFEIKIIRTKPLIASAVHTEKVKRSIDINIIRTKPVCASKGNEKKFEPSVKSKKLSLTLVFSYPDDNGRVFYNEDADVKIIRKRDVEGEKNENQKAEEMFWAEFETNYKDTLLKDYPADAADTIRFLVKKGSAFIISQDSDKHYWSFYLPAGIYAGIKPNTTFQLPIMKFVNGPVFHLPLNLFKNRPQFSDAQDDGKGWLAIFMRQNATELAELYEDNEMEKTFKQGIDKFLIVFIAGDEKNKIG